MSKYPRMMEVWDYEEMPLELEVVKDLGKNVEFRYRVKITESLTIGFRNAKTPNYANNNKTT
jgi:hypothetical protein